MNTLSFPGEDYQEGLTLLTEGVLILLDDGKLFVL